MTIAFENDYLNYVSVQKGYSLHTQQAYQKDLAELLHFL